MSRTKRQTVILKVTLKYATNFCDKKITSMENIKYILTYFYVRAEVYQF